MIPLEIIVKTLEDLALSHMHRAWGMARENRQSSGQGEVSMHHDSLGLPLLPVG